MVLVVKNPPANAGEVRDTGFILALGRSLGEGHRNPLHYSCLENPMDRKAWKVTVHRVTKSCRGLEQLHPRTHAEVTVIYTILIKKSSI